MKTQRELNAKILLLFLEKIPKYYNDDTEAGMEMNRQLAKLESALCYQDKDQKR